MAGRRKNTIQIRPNVTLETAMILEILSKKENKSMGIILEEMLKESKKFVEVKEKIYKI